MMEVFIDVTFETKDTFLNAFSGLYRSGFGCYIYRNRFDNSFEVRLDIRTRTYKDNIIKILKEFNPSHLRIRTIKKEYSEEVIIPFKVKELKGGNN